MKKMLFIFLISFISLIGGRLAFTQTMDNYCAVPPFISAQGPPIVMLVMGRDHKLYYEAYNDASDLDEDGELDVGYKHSIDYYGYFDPYKCYKYTGSGAAAKFVPTGTTPNKYCDGEGEWSGNFLNWLSMSRMDVLRKVLYGGYRSTDSSSETVLEGVYIPQDCHSWGKEYFGEDTKLLTPFDPPSGSCTIPNRPVSWNKTGEILFVIYDDDQDKVYGDDHDELLNSYSLCDYSSHSYITEMDTTDNYTNRNRIETGNYLLVAEFEVTSAGTWHFAIDSDDGSEVEIDGIVVANYYGGHWFCGCLNCGYTVCESCQNSHSGSIYLSNGWHRIIVRLRENHGDDGVIVWYKKPGDTAWTKFGSSTLNIRAPNIDDPCRLKTRDFIITGEPASGGGTVECERHLFCVTSTSEGAPHKIRVLLNKSNRIWEWASKENQVCDNSLGTPDGEYYVRVKVCDQSVGLEPNCKQYPNGNYKPIGLLQKFGEGDGTKVCSVSYKSCDTDSDCGDGEGFCVDKAKIYFGLLTGSYTKNLSGGVLRKNIWSISDEINPQTGIFQTSENTEGNIILTLDRLKTVGFEYSEDYNEYTCGWITTRPLNEGECRMWGNPIAEMIYETLRYFAGKGSPTSEFTYSASNDTGLHLSKPDWGIRKGGNTLQPPELFPWCSKPSIVMISDINPSYDSDTVPGSAFESYSGDLSDLNVADLAKTIGDEEGISGANANYFIGESNGVYDFICSSKEVSDLSKVRGLCPEEPTKQGSYYSAALAYYGHTKFKDNFTDPTKAENVTTYSVALSSPVPEIKIQVGEHTVTLVPVGKSVSGCLNVYNYCAQKCILTYDANKGLIISNCSPNAYCPSNQIVDFYVTEITPTHGKFRINFEDVEQGADHDMDSVVKYEYCVGDACDPALDANQVKITLSSDYAAGCIDQVLGFVISGTMKDGLYLPVKDSDTAPPPGDGNTPSVVASMPLTWEKTFTIPTTSGSSAATLLKNPLWYAAKWGGFEDINNNNKPDLSNEWDKDGDGKPDTYFFVANPLKLEEKLSKVFADILKRASSGTAVSMLSTSTRGSGIFCQAYFLPAFTDETTNEELSWLGHLKGFWIDSLGQIREDSDENKELELDQDKVMKYFLEGDKTKIHLYNSDNTGKVTSPCFPAETKTLADVKTVWDVGKKLWERTPGTDKTNGRAIYSSLDASTLTEFKADSSTATSLKPYLRTCDDTDALNVIKYVRGKDVDVCLDSDRGSCTYSTCNKGHRSRKLGDNIWKLGDIVYSTPRILSHFPLNLYHIRYQDKTYSSSNESHPGFIEQKVYDPHQGTPSPTIKRDNYLFVGANDGMLHCFYLGKLRDKFCYDPGSNSYTSNTCETDKDCDEGYLCKKNPDLEAKLEGDDIAKELWAYIPMNALPYLKYLANLKYDDCHIYYVDQRVMLFDASIQTSHSVPISVTTPDGNTITKNWATILIGEMRFGGSPNPPSDAPTVNGKTVGLSSIFALDITDPEDPDLLWEFTDPDLGFTTSYPAIVRIGDPDAGGPRQDDGLNGDWYVVLGSGPRDYEGDTPPSTGYIYVIDLKTGDLIRKISVGNHTYMGDCLAVDPDHDYTVDAIYCGTVKRQGSNVIGDMLRILTDEKGPNNWSITTFYNAGAPITASPELTFDEAGNLWCFFGTGKYFGETDKTDETQQYLYGIKDTCWDPITKTYTCSSRVTNIFDATNVRVTATPVDYICMCEGGEVDVCQDSQPAKQGGTCHCGDKVVTEVDLNSVTVSGCGAYSDWDDCAEHIANDFNGWKVELSVSSPAERCISKPGVVGQLAMFTTFTPNCDICGFGGDSSLFSLYYKAGIAYKEPAILLATGFKNGEIQRSVSIGKGAPAIGESIVTKQVGDKLVTYIQLSTGQVVEVTQKGIFMPNKVQFWIEE